MHLLDLRRGAAQAMSVPEGLHKDNKKRRRSMRRLPVKTILIAAALLWVDRAHAQTITSDVSTGAAAEFQLTNLLAHGRGSRRAGFSFMPASRSASTVWPEFTVTPAAGPSLPVTGSGATGRITKWAGFTSSSSVIGNSTIFEDKFGMVGIGTDTPTSRLTVTGLIESLGAGGGLKFPDGTIQTTSATGALFSISHDATLVGNGTVSLPLGVAVPLTLSGAVGFNGIINVTNTAEAGLGVRSVGSSSAGGQAGFGVSAFGGANTTSLGGIGVRAEGGNSVSSFGGNGVTALGGASNSSFGGWGVVASGGDSTNGSGGIGAQTSGGNVLSGLGDGGTGISALGGDSNGGFGGHGISASGGSGPLGDGLAGKFNGDVEITGMLSKGGGSFKIDHPLDPENRYLYHSFVESPDMKNIYDGNVVTDANGEATVELPAYFQSLNRDFRYQLTVLGTFAQAIVAEEIKGNRFLIRTSAPGVKVSWQVTGVRQDAWANKNRIKVEVEKTERERGYYAHPEAFDQPDERGIEWARNPEMMQQTKRDRDRRKLKNRQDDQR
jgi:hypothetical protein